MVRNLKSQKANKDEIKAAVDKLLALKKQYKDITGSDPPPPGAAPPKTVPAPSVVGGNAEKILAAIENQGSVVRNLKSQNADKVKIKSAVDELLALKNQYKEVTGSDPPPGGKAAPSKTTPSETAPTKTASVPTAPSKSVTNESSQADQLLEDIHFQGNLVRDLKSKKGPKDEVTAAVQLLIKHKNDYKALTGIWMVFVSSDFVVVVRDITARVLKWFPAFLLSIRSLSEKNIEFILCTGYKGI